MFDRVNPLLAQGAEFTAALAGLGQGAVIIGAQARPARDAVVLEAEHPTLGEIGAVPCRGANQIEAPTIVVLAGAATLAIHHRQPVGHSCHLYSLLYTRGWKIGDEGGQRKRENADFI